MANTILNFHFDYWHTSLTPTACFDSYSVTQLLRGGGPLAKPGIHRNVFTPAVRVIVQELFKLLVEYILS